MGRPYLSEYVAGQGFVYGRVAVNKLKQVHTAVTLHHHLYVLGVLIHVQHTNLRTEATQLSTKAYSRDGSGYKCTHRGSLQYSHKFILFGAFNWFQIKILEHIISQSCQNTGTRFQIYGI